MRKAMHLQPQDHIVNKRLLTSLTVLALSTVIAGTMTQNATAGTIIGGDGLLTSSGELQLEADLGAGTLTLTNIYSYKVNDSAFVNMWPAINNKGPTFMVIQAHKYGTSASASQIFGGYNDASWNGSVGWNSADPAGKNFLFNLTSNLVEHVKVGTAEATFSLPGYYGYGPAFGGNTGFNIGLHDDITDGYTLYHPVSYVGNNIFDNTQGTASLVVTDVQIFSVVVSPAPVAEPASMALLGLGVVSTGVITRRRRKATLTATAA